MRGLLRCGVACASTLLLLGACAPADPAPGRNVIGGNADRAPTLMRQLGCHACHQIRGVRGADGRVGPPLDDYRQRVYIAGRAPNTPDNLVRFLIEPRSIDPATAMPKVGASEQDARDMAAYLYRRR